jgi:hypothetical protein
MVNTKQSGRTTQQMLDAPKGAYYVWLSQSLSYPRQLAQHLKRADLHIVGPGFFSYKGRGQGIIADIVIDHGYVVPVTRMAEIDSHRRK